MFTRVALLFPIAGCLYGGVVKVVLVDHQSGQPLAHTRVTLQQIVPAGQSPVEMAAFTGKYGQHTFSDVAEGTYLLTARKRHYADGRYGQKSWRHPGLPFAVSSQQEVVAQIRMMRLGVLTGEVFDENRVGIPGVPVYAYRAGVRLRLAGKGESDDRGAFRIPGLTPGRYVVQSGGVSVDDRSLIPTYFGQTVRAYDARQVDAQIDSETPGSFIEPVIGKLHVLRVSTVAPLDVTVTVSLYTDGAKRDVQFQGPGVATYTDLPAGEYDVLVRTDARPPTSAYRRISLGRDEEVGMTVSESPQWRTNCTDRRGSPLPEPKAGFQVLVRRRQPAEEEWIRVPCGVSYTTPGLWEIRAVAPKGWYFAGTSAVQRENFYEVNVMNRPFVATDVQFGQRGAEVRGTVKGRGDESAAVAPVFLIPLDRDLRLRIGDMALATRADMEGKFWFTDIPPGRYAAVATWDRAEVDLREWVAQGTEQTIPVAEGSVGQVEIGIGQI